MQKTNLVISVPFIILLLLLTSCKGGKLPGGDARKFPADPAKIVEQNLKEGRGFKLNDAFTGPKTGVFDFLDLLEFCFTVYGFCSTDSSLDSASSSS